MFFKRNKFVVGFENIFIIVILLIILWERLIVCIVGCIFKLYSNIIIIIIFKRKLIIVENKIFINVIIVKWC